jgi:hypothetical protein
MLETSERAEIIPDGFVTAIVILFKEKLRRTRAKDDWFTA